MRNATGGIIHPQQDAELVKVEALRNATGGIIHPHGTRKLHGPGKRRLCLA
ncbi:MAG: hypothetical protein AB7O62_09330 [Pirellulales bacterium]